MAEPPVANASPLIFLAAGGCFELLRLTADSVVVPAAVADEIRRRGSADVTVQAMEHCGWVTVVPDPPVPNVILAWDLGPGESAVLAWALAHSPTSAIIDDLAARPVLERMVHSGMYLSDRVLNEALALVGE